MSVDGVAVKDTVAVIGTQGVFGSPVGTAKGQIAAFPSSWHHVAGTDEIVETEPSATTVLSRTVTITSR